MTTAARLRSTVSLGDFLRGKRERLRIAGPSGRSRRTPGLRREEVAERAGVSIDWYVRLEQNRAPSASAAVLGRLARALELDVHERRYLFRLAKRPDDAALVETGIAHESASVALRRLAAVPACVLGPRLDVLASNAAYETLFSGLGADPKFGRNVLFFACCDPRARLLFVDYAAVVAEGTAVLRASFARHLDSPFFLELIGELSRRSAEFLTCWGEQRVKERGPTRKRFRHAELGLLDLTAHALVPADAPDQYLAFYEPRDARTANALATLQTATAPSAQKRRVARVNAR